MKERQGGPEVTYEVHGNSASLYASISARVGGVYIGQWTIGAPGEKFTLRQLLKRVEERAKRASRGAR